MFKVRFFFLLLSVWLSGCAGGPIVTPAPSSAPTLSPVTATSTIPTTLPPMTPSPPPLATVTGSAATFTLTAPPPSATAQMDPLLVGAGDIAACGDAFNGDAATAALLDTISGTVVTLGDNAYPSGTADQFRQCYDPTWGRHKDRTRPVPGNHDYVTANAAAYYQYFGAAAGEAGKGYYSYDLGEWHIVALNSNCGYIGGCDTGSAEYQWLVADLAAHPAQCTLAYFHHPRFSSGPHGDNAFVQPLWQALYDAGADVVLNGHDHDYERFAPQTPSGASDDRHGIREFVVGTGGYSHYATGAPAANSAVRNGDTYGVLKLTLHAHRYDWQFVPVSGGTFSDAGTGECHSVGD